MPEIVKYERIETAETDLHAAQPDEDDDIINHQRISDGISGNHNGTTIVSSLESRIEMPIAARYRFNMAQKTAATAALILFYFCLSIGLTFYQRWVLTDFSFPLFVVLCHLVIKLLISLVIRGVYRICTGRSRILIDWRTSLQKVSLTGVTSGIDIGFSNWGLELVTISLYTMTKSSTIIFILLFAILLGLERKSWSLMSIVIMISVGLCLFTYKATEFNALGFSFILFASLVSGMRWSFAQLIMQRSKLGLHNPIDMVFHMQPWMILSVLPFTIGFEGRQLYDGWQQFDTSSLDERTECWTIVMKIVTGAVIAFFMELSEFLVLTYTSSLTMAVSNILKEICALVLAVELNGDRLSALNVVGLVMCLGGICSHVLHKYRMMQKTATANGGGIMQRSTNGGSNAGRGHGDGEVDGAKSSSAGDRCSIGSTSTMPQSWRSVTGQQSVPLLNGSLDDSDEEDGDDGNQGRQNSSDIIFDVLKRRDTRRLPVQ